RARPPRFPYTPLFRSELPSAELAEGHHQEAGGLAVPQCLTETLPQFGGRQEEAVIQRCIRDRGQLLGDALHAQLAADVGQSDAQDRKSTRLNSSHVKI